MVAAAEETVTSSPEETMEFGRRLARRLKGGEVLAVRGELGAGKTTMIKGIADGLGVADTSEVRSPTFVLLRVYEGTTAEGKAVSINHVDAYRLEGGGGFEDMGGLDLLDDLSVCIIEWADRVADGLPTQRIDITLEHVDPTTRRITLDRGRA